MILPLVVETRKTQFSYCAFCAYRRNLAALDPAPWRATAQDGDGRVSGSIDVLADDLTGAADTAAAFARPDRPVRLSLAPQAGQGPAEDTAAAGEPGQARPDGRVRAIDLDVRNAPEGADVGAVYAAHASHLRDDEHVYVKIDSTLRGHVKAAVAGVCSRLCGHLVICAPAFPSVGRTVRDGVPLVHGVELRHSGVWRVEPRRAPLTLLEVLPEVPRACLPVDVIRGSRMAEALSCAADARQLVICDTADDNDLRRLTRAAVAMGRPVLWIGSAGLARALAGELLGEALPPADGGQLRSRWRRFLAVMGSASPVGRRQAEALAAAGATPIAVPCDVLLDGDESRLRPLAAVIAAAAGRRNVVVSVTDAAAGREDRWLRPSSPAEQSRMADSLGRVVAPAMERTDLAVLTGGATARAVLQACSVSSLDVVQEIRPGIVLSIPCQSRAPRVITKAGAFGNERALVELLYK
jgi:uncharacterized protein YgbK (DUF1537 family)